MRVISWNVNGIRAWYKKGNLEWLSKESPDIFCIQETKAEETQLPDELRNPPGYYSFLIIQKAERAIAGLQVFPKLNQIWLHLV